MIKNKIKKVIGLIVFLCLLGTVYARITYLFRNNNWEQQHINGMKNEDSLDVVCVGGSSTFVYWEPFLAWNEFGMTSYNFATASARPAIMKGYVKEAVERANPDLVVIDMRCYANGAIDVEKLTDAEGGIRNMTDSLDLNVNRLIAVNDVMRFYNAFKDDSVDPWSFYFDIAKYHTNYAQLGVEDNWKHLNNGNYESPYKGFEFITFAYHDFVNEPVDYKTDEVTELNPTVKESLIDLLEYLSKNDIEALFVAGPIPVNKGTQALYNCIGETVGDYGYNFLNTNDYYEEMGTDFSKDFYNSGHVNVYGAEKYTRFVSEYIKANYEIDDHRSEDEFSEWDEFFNVSHEQDLIFKDTIDKLIAEKNVAFEKGKNLKTIESFEEWVRDANDTNFTVIAVAKGAVPDISSPWNVTTGTQNIIRVYTAGTAIAEFDSEQAEDYSATIGTHSVPIVINSGDKAKVTISGIELSMDDEGLYYIAFDNNYNQILDCIYLSNSNEMKHVYQ